MFFSSTAYATLYSPGDTLNPDCAPTDSNCGITATGVSNGGTGISSYAVGDLLYGASTTTLAKLTIGSDGQVLGVSSTALTWITPASAVNISNTDLTLSAARSLALNGNALTFDGTNDVVFSNAGDVTVGSDLNVVGALVTQRGSDFATTGTQNDVNFGSASFVRYTGTAGATITGIAGGANGRILRIANTSSFDLVFNNQDTNSSAANRIAITTGNSVTISSNGMITFIYDSGDSRWRIVSNPVGISTISGFAFVQGGNALATTTVLGTTDANALNFITSGNTRFSLASGAATLTGSGATTLTSNSTLALSSGVGSALTITASSTGALTLDSGTTGAVNLGTGSNAKTITIGNTTGATALNLNAGTAGITLTGHVAMGSVSTTLLSALSTLSVGSTTLSIISGNGGLSTLRSDLAVTGSTTLQNFTAVNATATGNINAASFSGDAQNLTLARIGSSTFSTLQDLQNVFHSAGYTSGGAITDAGLGTINVASGTGLLRSSNSALATIFYADWSAMNGIVIATNTVKYIGVEYNSGSPQVTVRSSANWDYKTDFPLGVVTNENGTLHVLNDVQGVGDHAATMIQREYETMPLERDERNGGLMLEESGDGNRNIMLSAGALWDRLTRYPISAFDTASTSTFDTYAGSTRQATGQTQWDNTRYNASGTLATMTANYYAVLWFYVETDGGLAMVYGVNQYSTLAGAVAEDEPMSDELPSRLVVAGKLVGRLIFRKSATTATEVTTAFNMNSFSSAALTYLSNLQGLDYNSSGLTGFVASGGVDGGQTIIGGTTVTSSLTLQSTSATGTTDFIRFLVGTNGGTEAVRIINNGNVGIGTIAPQSKFQVSGTATFSNIISSSTTASSSFAGPLFVNSTFSVSSLSTLANLALTGSSTLQNFTGVSGVITNVSSTNLTVSGASNFGTISSGLWNGTAIGPTFGGTNQTTWTKGDILYASANDTLSRLPIGSSGTVLTAGAAGVPTWAAAGGGGGGGGSGVWATSTNGLAIYPSDPSLIVLVGSSATTTLGTSVSAILDVTGNSAMTGNLNVSGVSTFGSVSTTNATVSSSLRVGANVTIASSGTISAAGLITASGAGTGLSVTNNASVGGLATIANLFLTGSSTLQTFTATSAIITNVTTTNLFATNFTTSNFNPANLSTDGTLTVLSGLSTLANVSTTGNLLVNGSFSVAGLTTATSGIVDTNSKYRIGGVDVLTSSTLGSSIVNSSLTSLGTLGSLSVSGLSTLANVSTTGNLLVNGSFSVAGLTTATSGIVDTNSKYRIGGTDVLTSNTLGSGIVNSSLTSLGTLGSLSVSGHSAFANVSTTAAMVSSTLSIGTSTTLSSNGNISTVGTITSGLINGQTISSSANFTGTLTTASLLTASNGFTLSSGTLTLPSASIADSALSSNVALLNGSNQTFTGTSTFSSLTTFANASATSLSVSSGLTVSGNFVTPKGTDYTTTGSQNDVSLGTGALFRYTGGSAATFTGIAGGADGRFIRIVNASVSSLTLSNESASSTAANRITTATGADLTIPSNVSVGLQYDSGASRWRVVVLPATSATVSSFAFVQGGNAFSTSTILGTTDSNSLAFITAGNTRFTLASGASTLTGSGATTITTNNTLSLSSGAASNLSVIASTTGALTLDSGTTGSVYLGAGTSSKTITIGNVTGTTTLNLNSGSGGMTFTTASSTFALNTGTGAINIGTDVAAKTITIGNTTGTTTLNLQSGTGNIKLQVAGTSTTGNVQIGAGGGGSATPDLFVLDVKNTSGDPTGTNGAMYYSSSSNKFRCYENGAWTNCIGSVSGTFTDNTLSALNPISFTVATEAWDDTTRPNISVTKPSTKILVNVVIRGISDDANDQNPVFIVRRATSSNPTCSGAGGTQIGTEFAGSFLTATSQNWGASASFVDSATFAGGDNVRYTACTATTGLDDGNLSSTIVSLIELGADLAENYYTADDSINEGDVVTIDSTLPAGVKKSVDPYDRAVIGIISTAPGMILDDAIGLGYGRKVPVALAGRVPVKVSNKNGAIQPGDFLTSSDIPGVAMKATKAGPVIGKALTGWSADGIGSIGVFVNNTYFPGGEVASDAGISAEALDDFVLTGGLQVAGEVDLGEDSVGEAVIRTGVGQVAIVFEKPYAYQPIVTVSKMTQGMLSDYYVDEVTKTGFKIKVDPVQGKDMIFSWHAFGAKGGVRIFSDGMRESLNVEAHSGSSGGSPVVPTTSSDSSGGSSSALSTPTDSSSTPSDTPSSGSSGSDGSASGGETVTPSTTIEGDGSSASTDPPASTASIPDSSPPAESSPDVSLSPTPTPVVESPPTDDGSNN